MVVRLKVWVTLFFQLFFLIGFKIIKCLKSGGTKKPFMRHDDKKIETFSSL